MRKLGGSARAAAAVLVVSSAAAGFGCATEDSPCASAGTERVIDASAETVWDVMTDAGSYPDWNPYIVEIRPADVDITQVGASFELRVLQPVEQVMVSVNEVTIESKGPETGQAVLRYQPNDLLGAFSNYPIRTQTVTPLSPTQSLYATEEVFCTDLLDLLPLESVQQGFELHGDGLKAEAEARAGN